MADINRLRTIKLRGNLGKRFGKSHTLAVGSAAEGIRALGVLLPGFNQFLAESKDRGLAFALFYGKRNIGQDELRDPPGVDDIVIAPVVQGSKSGGGLQTVLGIALIAAASFFSGGTAAGGVGLYGSAGWAGGAAWAAVGSIGFSLAIGGVAQMISGTQPGISSSESADNRPSYNFSGIKNTVTQGNPVPLCYGEMIVGSAMLSLGIVSEDEQ